MEEAGDGAATDGTVDIITVATGAVFMVATAAASIAVGGSMGAAAFTAAGTIKAKSLFPQEMHLESRKTPNDTKNKRGW